MLHCHNQHNHHYPSPLDCKGATFYLSCWSWSTCPKPPTAPMVSIIITTFLHTNAFNINHPFQHMNLVIWVEKIIFLTDATPGSVTKKKIKLSMFPQKAISYIFWDWAKPYIPSLSIGPSSEVQNIWSGFFYHVFSKTFGEKWWCLYPFLHFRYQTAIPTIHPVKVDSDFNCMLRKSKI